jgi:hypothetical protein
MNSDSMVQCVLLVLAVILIGYLLMNSNDVAVAEEVSSNEGFYGKSDVEYFEGVEEGFEDQEPVGNGEPEEPEVNANANANANGNANQEAGNDYGVEASNPLGQNEGPRGLSSVEGSQLNSLPAECYPKDVLNAQDLLPRDANSTYAQVAPSGQGCLQDKNFLTAGFHVGVNTVGQSLRNANRQLRSDPPNPQVKVSPWMQTTIEPDSNRKCFEVGCDQ